MLPCVTMMELSHATAEDPILQRVIKYSLTKWPISVDSESQPYFRFRDEFSMDSGLLQWGDKIVIPTSIQQRLLHFAHEKHFGISKSKARLWRSYWWPGMDKDVEKLVHHCFCCQQTPRDSPVQVTDWETTPWYHLSMDIAGPKRDCKGHTFYIIALIDDHSRYVVAQVIRSIRTTDIIQFLSTAFFRFCGKLTTMGCKQLFIKLQQLCSWHHESHPFGTTFQIQAMHKTRRGNTINHRSHTNRRNEDKDTN